MRLIWLCNMVPTAVGEHIHSARTGGTWIDHVLEGVQAAKSHTLRLYCPGEITSGQLDDRTDYVLFEEKLSRSYHARLEDYFAGELRSFHPDVIHIWGTEFAHTLAMVNAARKTGLSDRVVISIQGLCGIYAQHYEEGVPRGVCRRYSLRDLLKRDNITCQRRKFVQRGRLETQALENVSHVIGRTDWDRAITDQIHPGRVYHFCNETLRSPFYQDTWQYDKCIPHRIFVSSCSYPVKGFHYLLEAMPAILQHYPDTTISVTGSSFLQTSLPKKLRQDYYHRYLSNLAAKNGLEGKIHFLGGLNADQMKRAYLDANVFALPSTIENSPNSLGEAMLLGVPCVAADVGGVGNLMHPGEGFLYQSTAPYMLASYIVQVFDMQEQAEKLGRKARARARITHDPEKNLSNLLAIYESIREGGT